MIIGAGQQFPRNNSHCKLLCHFEADASDSSVGHSETHTPTVNGSPSYGAGKFGNCIDFGSTNTDKYVTFPDCEDWDIPSGIMFTVSLWYNLSSNTTKATLFNRNITDSTTIQSIQISYRGNISPKVIRITINNVDTNFEINLDTGIWYHFAICSNKSYFMCFHNGLLIQSIAAESLVSNQILSIGANFNGDNLFSGKIDEFAWIKGECLWTRNFTPPNRAA
jgi:hypothetical protein